MTNSRLRLMQPDKRLARAFGAGVRRRRSARRRAYPGWSDPGWKGRERAPGESLGILGNPWRSLGNLGNPWETLAPKETQDIPMISPCDNSMFFFILSVRFIFMKYAFHFYEITPFGPILDRVRKIPKLPTRFLPTLISSPMNLRECKGRLGFVKPAG
jgi:hypothetical protein